MSIAKRAAIYARTATIQELGANFAMQEQVRQGLEYATRQGYEIIDGLIYEEGGSSISIDRPGLTALQEAAKQGIYDILIVSSFDRISRKQDQAALFFNTMEGYGVKIESVLESFEDMTFEAFAKDMYKLVELAQRDMLAKRRQQGRKTKSRNTNAQEAEEARDIFSQTME